MGCAALNVRVSRAAEQVTAGAAAFAGPLSPGRTQQERRPTRASGMNFVHIRIMTALLKKKKDMAALPTPITFSKIILRFDRLRAVLKHVVDVFKTLAEGKSGLNLDGLQKSMLLLHGELTRAETMELFNFVDIDESKYISLKEFLVALTVGYVLEVIPALVNAKSVRVPSIPLANPKKDFSDLAVNDQTQTHAERHDSLSAFMGKSDQIKEMLSLIVMAYLLFDRDGEGFIRKEAVERLLEEDGHKTGSGTVLDMRWKEMDWDANGTIDFAEFVFSFTSWVDTQDTMEDDA